MRRFSEMRWEIRQTTKEKIMGIFSMILSLLSGVALFLFGMSLMGDGLKMVAGNKLEAFLYRMTNTPLKGVGHRFCKLRYDEAETGDRYYHGS